MQRVTVFCAPFEGDSHALLYDACARLYGEEARMWRIAPGVRGKPYFIGVPEAHFSISHTDGLWLCALSDRPVGLDAQAVRQVKAELLAARCFHPRERAYLASHPESFFALWAAKESCVKLTGHGIGERFRDVCTVGADGAFPSAAGACLRMLTAAENAPCCLATYIPADVRVLPLREG